MRSAAWRIACCAIALAAFGILALSAFGSARAAGNDVPAATSSQQNPRCGATAADALKEARQSLAKPDATSERAALACLIEATAALDARIHNLDMGRAPSGMLHAIDVEHPPTTNGK